MIQVPRKSKKYGFLDGKSANGLYRDYKKYCGDNNIECMPFDVWLRWAQDRGIVRKNPASNNLNADAEQFNNYAFEDLKQLIVQMSDDDISNMYSKMSQAKSENWNKDNLLTISGPVRGLQISDQKILGRAISILESEMIRRNLPITGAGAGAGAGANVGKPINKNAKILIGVLIAFAAISITAVAVSNES